MAALGEARCQLAQAAGVRQPQAEKVDISLDLHGARASRQRPGAGAGGRNRRGGGHADGTAAPCHTTAPTFAACLQGRIRCSRCMRGWRSCEAWEWRNAISSRSSATCTTPGATRVRRAGGRLWCFLGPSRRWSAATRSRRDRAPHRQRKYTETCLLVPPGVQGFRRNVRGRQHGGAFQNLPSRRQAGARRQLLADSCIPYPRRPAPLVALRGGLTARALTAPHSAAHRRVCPQEASQERLLDTPPAASS